MILKIYIPNNNKPEIEYSLHCLFEVFLGLQYTIILWDDNNIKIETPSGSFEIQNHFFVCNDIAQLFTYGQIPKTIKKTELTISGIKYPIVSLFGTPKLSKKENEYFLEENIIASTFFMLTRWEEYVNEERDVHNRFAGSSSIAFKNNFLDRPIINEYVEIIWALLKTCGFNANRKKRSFTIVPTHDVDSPYMWWSQKSKIKSVLNKVYYRKFREGINNIKHLIKGTDPYDTHDLFMNMSEKAGVKSCFFFMTGGETNYDNRYRIDHPRILTLIQNIKNRGHIIGLHPSYNSYNKPDLLSEEKNCLVSIGNIQVESGRQHYLRFEVPTTWKIWNDLGLKWDSTLSYADSAGFRAGVCYSYPVFDFLKREMLNLHERPLIIMDSSLIGYEKLNLNAAIIKSMKLKEEVRKYNGEFVFLWHNSSFNDEKWIGYESLLLELY